jgi:hypothetical protein
MWCRRIFGSVVIAAGFVHLASTANCGRFPDSLKNRLNIISEKIYNDQFDEADQLIDSLRESGHQRAFYHLFRAISLQSQMMAEESYIHEKALFIDLDSVEVYARHMLEQGSDSALAYYFLGQSNALSSIFKGRTNHKWGTFKKGLAAGKSFTKGYRIDTTFHDLAFGLGCYRYWKSVKTRAINWTPLFKNEKENGIKLVRLATDSSGISKDAARSALIWIYINEKNYGQAISIANLMRHKYPQGMTFLWALGQAHYDAKDCRSAIEVYESIMSRLKTAPGNYHNIIEAGYYLSVCYGKLGDREPDYLEKLGNLQDKIRSYRIPEKIRKKQKKKLSKILKDYK